MPPFCSRAPGMGCVFCKKLEPGAKEDDGLEGDFKNYGAADRYGPTTLLRAGLHLPFPTSPTTT